MRNKKADAGVARTGQGTAERAAELPRLCHSMAENSPQPMVAVEGSPPVIRYVNPAFCLLAGKTREDLVGRVFAAAVPEAERQECSALIERVYRTGTSGSLTEREHPYSDTKHVCWSYTVWVVLNAEERPAGLMVQITDATEAARFRRDMVTLNEELLLSGVRQHELTEVTVELNAHLQTLATTDGLTGLKNYRTFHERLTEEVTRAVRYATPLSVLFVDVDNFKAYNDTYGHPAGDAALRQIAEVLVATARTNDLIARYGGEEFAVILPETDAENAILAAERFRAAVEAAAWKNRQITVSLGAATLPSTSHDPATLVGAADEALYFSKQRGRNCVTHSLNVASS